MRHRENNQNLLTFSGHLEVLRKLLFRILGVTVCIAVIIFSLKMKPLEFYWLQANGTLSLIGRLNML